MPCTTGDSMNRLHSLLHWMFTVPDGERNIDDIITWWEHRRIPYNLIMGSVIFVNFVLFHLAFTGADTLPPGEGEFEVTFLISASLPINICYTLGWLVEISKQSNIYPRKDPTIGPRLLKVGLIFSLIVVLFPSVFWVVFYVLQFLGFVGKQ